MGDAAGQALDIDAGFNPGAALLALLDEQAMTFDWTTAHRRSVVSVQVYQEAAWPVRAFSSVQGWLSRVPVSLLQLLMRIAVGSVFFNHLIARRCGATRL